MADFGQFLCEYERDYFVGWYITRIEDIEKYCRDGILTLNGNFDEGVID